jgi:AcrR family transcriptional regulator
MTPTPSSSLDTGPVRDEVGAATDRPMRADAVRNRTRILEAAEAVFAAQGVSVPIDDIAARAGVGAGTLYRHFPTKEALIEAVVLRRLDELAARAAELATTGDPATGLFEFLDELGCQASAKRDLIDALGDAGIDIKPRFAATKAEMERGVDDLLTRAQTAGAVRDDVDVHEVLGLAMGTCMATRGSGDDAAVQRRLLGVVCDGLRVRRADP